MLFHLQQPLQDGLVLLEAQQLLQLFGVLPPVGPFSVNGVAALHTDILKNSELKHFYDIYPEKFNNKTNGVTFRRWLEACNPELTALIDGCIGCSSPPWPPAARAGPGDRCR